MKKLTIILFTLLISCTNNDDDSTTIPVEDLYFPPLTGTIWETKTLSSLGWNENNIEPLLDYLEEKNTKGFIVLHKGKIVIEEYFNNHTVDSNWYWASVGKTLTSLTIGIAQEEGYLSISDKTSDYLGTNWTSLSSEKEELVKIKNQLSMTTGFDDNQFDCLTANCLTYVADAGTRWSYHNGPYTLLDVVIIDTAGRLHNKVNLMHELTKIKKVMQKVVIDAPHEILLVLDGSTGQNAFEQAKAFSEATEVNALAVTKLDGTAKGGVVIGISDQFQIPVKYIGVGEGIDDLQVFNKIEFVDSFFK